MREMLIFLLSLALSYFDLFGLGLHPASHRRIQEVVVEVHLLASVNVG